MNIELQHFRISQEHEKMIEQLKYMLSLDPNLVKEQLFKLLNKLPPFLDYPLDSPPPVQLFEVDKNQASIITQDLKTQLTSYCFIILRGSVVISRQSYQFTQEKYIDNQNIRQKSVYNFDQGLSRLTAAKRSVYLKVHSIWVKKAKKKSQDREKQYIKKKLIQVDFFSGLTFEEFSQCCNKATVKKLGPQQILLKQLQTPYNMYIVAQGELSLETKVKLTKDGGVWNEVKAEIKKKNQFCQELFEYLVREPNSNDDVFEIDFSLKQIHQGQIVAAKQTLLEQPLQYTIKATLSTKIICIKYPDLYVLKEERLADIRNWPYLCEIDKKQLRRQYYSMMNWNQFKEFLRQENRLAKIQRTKFDYYLRKDVNLNSKRYNFCPQKVTQGRIIQSPAGKVLRMKDMSSVVEREMNLSTLSTLSKFSN